MAESQTVATFIGQSKEFCEQCHEFYKPLNPDRKEIRLMQILPGLFAEDQVNLLLSQVDLADEPYYETISYTWGPMSPTKQVFIHGSAYNVTVNQYDALRRLRSDQPRVIWMDVICIDQANLAERAHQVSIMGEIYANAARTDIWLGELDETWYTPISDDEWNSYVTKYLSWTGDGDGDSARATLIKNKKTPKRDELMKNFPHDLVEGAKFMLEQFATNTHYADLPHCAIVGDDIEMNKSWYDAAGLLCAILQRPWWNRVWVLQETLLCRENPMVLFGGHQMLLETFFKASDSFFQHTFVSQCCAVAIEDLFLEAHMEILVQTLFSSLRLSKVKHEEVPGQMSIMRAAGLTDTKEATDPRDFVYGLLGLIRAEDRMPVDYTLSTEQVFVLTSWHYFRVQNDFDWLEKGGGMSPSWSIDWTHVDRLDFTGNWTFTKNDTETPDWDRTRLSGSCLELPANCISKIKLVFDKGRNPDVASPRADFEIICYWFDCLKEAGFPSDLLRDPTSDEFDGEFFVELFSIFFRDTKGDLKMKEWRRLNPDDYAEIAFWWSGMVELGKTGRVDVDDHLPFMATAWNFRSRTKDSALALTEGNKICLVPVGTAVGDSLYHIRACSPIMVLHPVAENVFSVVGPGYHHDAMGSEGWRQDEEKVITLN